MNLTIERQLEFNLTDLPLISPKDKRLKHKATHAAKMVLMLQTKPGLGGNLDLTKGALLH